MIIHAVHDKILDSGTSTIMVDQKLIKTFKKSLADLQTQPEAFKFLFEEVELHARLSADVQSQQLTLKVEGVPYD